MDFQNMHHLGYYFIIEINTEHPAIKEQPTNFTDFPGNDRAMFSSHDFSNPNDCIEAMKTTVSEEISTMNDRTKQSHRILLEKNDFSNEEKEEYKELFTELEWMESELFRMYGLDKLTESKDFTGHEWFIRARMFYNDYGKYIFPAASNLQ